MCMYACKTREVMRNGPPGNSKLDLLRSLEVILGQKQNRSVYMEGNNVCARTTEWLPWLQLGDNGYEQFILVLEVNCISNLSPNHTLQLTILRTTVSESLQNKYDDFVVILSQRLVYLQDIIACSLMYMQV